MYPARTAVALSAIFAATLLTACATAPKSIDHAVVELRATQQPQPDPDAPVTGELHFKQWQDQVVITGQVEHLPPRVSRAVHGNALHILAVADCAAPDPAKAGGIFNPAHKKHSYPGAGMAGDLPMLMPDEQGTATINNYLSSLIKLDGPDSVIGKAVVVRRDIDDWAIQPDGNAGPAIACGVIRAAAPDKK